MGNEILIENLKYMLRHEVALFCQRDRRKWKSEIWKTVDEIRNNNWPAVFFGGTLRSLLLSRIGANKIGHPRDVDIVVRGIDVNELREQFENYFARDTRFGGIQLTRRNYQFDLWPLDKTFAFEGKNKNPDFADLPRTTFLNIEAIAIDVWAKTGRPRYIYSGDDQFFRGILSRTVELNNAANPFPELCVARALVMACDLQWKVGPRLIEYIRTNSSNLSGSAFEEVQRKHYGGVRLQKSAFKRVKEFLHGQLTYDAEPVELPLPRQLNFWENHDQTPQFRIAFVKPLKGPTKN